MKKKCELVEYIDETIICRYTGKECIYSFSPIQRDYCKEYIKYNNQVDQYLSKKGMTKRC